MSAPAASATGCEPIRRKTFLSVSSDVASMHLQTARRGEGSPRTAAAMELFVPAQLIFTQFSNQTLGPGPPQAAATEASVKRGVSEKSVDCLQVDRPFIPG